jgi:hypothetical protein
MPRSRSLTNRCTSSLGILQSKLPSASATYQSSDVIAAKINFAIVSLLWLPVQKG